jgi:hypothetical protein
VGWQLIAVVVLVLASSQGAWGQSVFEDRNANGVFDGSDVDLTSLILASESGAYETVHEVVIDKSMSQRCEDCSISIESAKRITVNASVSSRGKGGLIQLHADEVVIGSKVTLNGIGGIDVHATRKLSIGSNVRLQALGASPTYGYGTVTLAGGTIDIGPELKVDSNDTVYIQATATDLSIGPKSTIVSRHGDTAFFAQGDVSIDSAPNIRGRIGITVSSERGAVTLGNSRLRASPMLVLLMGESVEANLQLLSKPYAIYDNDHPNGLYVTK